MKECKGCGCLMDDDHEQDLCECCMDDGLTEVQEEPKIMNISDKLKEVWPKLRPYQQDGVKFMIQRRHNLNFDDMGLGKTVCTLFSALYKMQNMDVYADTHDEHVLILCPVKALGVWQQELEQWFGVKSLIYSGTPEQRKKLAEQIPKNLFIVTTYGMLKEMNQYHVIGLICDEIHEGSAGLLNHKNKTYAKVASWYSRITWSFLLTGTPVRQGVIDLYAPLHLVDGAVFQNYWQFVNKYCIVLDTPFGKEIQRNPRDIEGFRNLLSKYRLRRIKSEVLQDLPGKQRQIIPITMTKKQAKAHQDILEDFIYADEDSAVVAPNAMTAILRCRQLLVSPRLLGIDEDGAAFDYLADEGKELLKDDKCFVVFTPFKMAIPLLEDLIKGFGLGTKIFTLMGGLQPTEFARQWQGFLDYKSNNKVLLCVIKSGASFHATCASDCFFLGYEWDFNLCVQAEDRLCRLGQKNFVHCRYLLHPNSVDELVKEKLNDKNAASNWVIGTDEQYKCMLRCVKSKVKL